MITTLAVTLVLSAPVALFGWLGALAVDRAGAGLRARRGIWSLTFAAPPALVPMTLIARASGWSVPLLDGAPVAQSGDLVAPPADTLASAMPSAAAVSAGVHEPNWAAIFLAVVALGAAARLAGLAWRGLALAQATRRAEPLAGDFHGMSVRLYDGEAPILVGLIKPVILLPRELAETLSPSQIALICAHERAHLRAGDHISTLLEACAMAVFWFNPFLAPIRAGLSAVREEACDAVALGGAERSTRRAYAEALLAAIRHVGGVEPAVAFTGLYRARSARRLRAILTSEAGGTRAALALAAAVGVILTGAAGGVSFAFAGASGAAPQAVVTPPLTRLAQGPAQTVSVAAAAPKEAAARPAAEVPTATLLEPDASTPPARSASPMSLTMADRDTVEALRGMLVSTRLARVDAQARLKALDTLPIETWPEVRRDADVRETTRQIEVEQARYDTLLLTFPANGPGPMRQKAKIDDLRAELVRRAQLVRSDMETELKVLEGKEAVIVEQLRSPPRAAASR